jgi:hypothetical protein
MKIKMSDRHGVIEEWNVKSHYYDMEFPVVICVNGDEEAEFILARHDEHAGELAKLHWLYMAMSDPREFAEIIGIETMVSWLLGDWAGPGNEHARSFEEWLNDVVSRYPAETLSVDDMARTVFENEELEAEVGFMPRLAYRRAQSDKSIHPVEAFAGWAVKPGRR